jgi:hypothetical protein
MAAVIEIEHRSDGIDADAVNVEFAQPVERARQQKVRYLPAAIVIDQRVPVGMKTLPRVRVFVERGSVEPPEAMRVGRKVPGNPVEQ